MELAQFMINTVRHIRGELATQSYTAARPARTGTAAPEWQNMKRISGKRAGVPVNNPVMVQVPGHAISTCP